MNSMFEDNEASSGFAITLTACDKTGIFRNPAHCTITFQVLFVVQNTTFTTNSGSSLYLDSIGHAKVITSTFFNNKGSGILSNQSNIYMEGEVFFLQTLQLLVEQLILLATPCLAKCHD